MNSAKYILDSNGTAVYDGERIMVVSPNGLYIGILRKMDKWVFDCGEILFYTNIDRFESFYKLMERQVINE